MDRGAWRATVHRVTQSELNMTELTAGTQSRDNDRAACVTSIQQSGRLSVQSLEYVWQNHDGSVPSS